MAMPWEVEYTDEFGEWFDGLGEEAQEDVALAVEKLEERGPALPRPLSGHGRGLPALEHEGTEAAGDEHPGAICLRSTPHGDPAHRRRQDGSLE